MILPNRLGSPEAAVMPCPPPLAAILLDILYQGILACRAGPPERCAVEADHIHNVPALLADYSADRLRYYWDVERPLFASRRDPDRLPFWDELWDRLRPLVERASEPIQAR